MIFLDSLSGSMLDPSLPMGAKTTSKMGIDATLASPQTGQIPKPYLPRTQVNEEAMKDAEGLIAGVDPKNWPTL